MEPVSQQALTLDDQEKEILTKTGIPPVFAIFLKQKSAQFGMAFALRTSPPVQRYLMPAAPKPAAVKAKTGNWSFTKGVIAVEPALGKIEKVNGVWQVVERTNRDFPDPKLGILNEVLHRLSLQEVLSGLAGGEYKLVGTEEDIQDSGVITIQSGRKSPDHTDIIFSIDLKDKPPRVETQCKIDLEKMLVTPPPKPARPAWWQDEWGNFADCIENYYPAQYKHAADINFMDIMVYGIADSNHNILPITADQDLLWISIPAKQHNSLWKDFEEVINTFEQDGVEKLYLARVELFLRLGGDPDKIEENIKNESIAGLGSVTPYESYVIDQINTEFLKAGVKHIRNLIQHASENHNPDPEHLAPLDVSIVHVWRGKISMTRTEKEMISFILQDEYPRENIINVHPKWDMAKWSAVIHTQIDLQQPIPLDTLAAYKSYREKNKGFVNLLQWVQKKDESS
jgi:hypothetical protein